MRWLMVLVLVLVGETLGGPVAVPAPFPAGVGPDGTKYKTAYKCEGEQLTISCASDQTIKVTSAGNREKITLSFLFF